MHCKLPAFLGGSAEGHIGEQFLLSVVEQMNYMFAVLCLDAKLMASQPAFYFSANIQGHVNTGPVLADTAWPSALAQMIATAILASYYSIQTYSNKQSYGVCMIFTVRSNGYFMYECHEIQSCPTMLAYKTLHIICIARSLLVPCDQRVNCCPWIIRLADEGIMGADIMFSGPRCFFVFFFSWRFTSEGEPLPIGSFKHIATL